MTKIGTGGGLRYITEEATPNMVNQEQSHSCQAACARQLLHDAGVQISEAELLAKIGYIEEWGTTSAGTAKALDDLHPRLGFAGGAVGPDAVPVLFKKVPWVASLTQAIIKLSDFMEHWHWAINNAVFPNRLK
jgi:hypothetical protein